VRVPPALVAPLLREGAGRAAGALRRRHRGDRRGDPRWLQDLVAGPRRGPPAERSGPPRGLGVARRLVEALLEEGQATGGRVVYLEVRAGNVAARRLYRRLGFRDLGIRRGYYGPGQDAIVMERRLAPDR